MQQVSQKVLYFIIVFHLLQLSIHLLYLFLHAANFRLARLNLALQLLDLKVEHKLEFLQLASRRGTGFNANML